MSTTTESTLSFKLQCSKLLDGLKQVSGVIENAQVMQILSCVKFTLSPGRFMLVASDSDIQITCEVEDDLLNLDASVSFAVPGKKLFEICRSLPNGETLTFKLAGDWLQVSTSNTKFKLVTMSAEDFPIHDFKPDHILSLQSTVFSRALTYTSFAMAVHDVRQFLNGLLLDIQSDSLRFVSTDGHRLALYEVDNISTNFSGRFIMPRKAVNELVKLIRYGSDSFNVELSEKMIRVESGGFALTTTLIKGQYPDYTRLLPKESQNAALVPVAPLKSALMRAAILSQERFKAVRLNFEAATLNLYAENSQREQVHEKVDLDQSASSGDIAFNLNYLLDVLNVLESLSVSVSYGTPKQAVVLKPTDVESVLFIIMPLTL
ncbi:MAG: DNA polymerase III subunit beta [Legionellales bacterium]|nr:DNA polymerase III subunit beta [Legionellales bacterium]OUX64623.1 MAG: DNA polymerase III subunit beta [Gammaproteobacteria bacterium TMED281]